tara:strand:+ start:28 stop:330 length:303 start_codon:yes stop_codon:yes gene_type:complete
MEIPPCNRKVRNHGHLIVTLNAEPDAVQTWVRSIAQESKAVVDWHYSEGRVANVLYLGDKTVRARVDQAIDNLEGSLDGQILDRIGPGDSEQYRERVPSL